MRRVIKGKKNVLFAAILVILAGALFAACSLNIGKNGGAVYEFKLGSWVDTKQKSERDGKLYPMKYRITAVDRDKASVDKRIEEYNASARGSTIEPLANDNLEYGIADYEAYYPKDFPDDEFGITAVAVPFSIAGVDGESQITVDGVNYKGLTDTWEIGAPPMGYDFYSDSTYKGSIVFVMVKGNKDYAFAEGYKEDGEDIVHYTEGK